MFPRVLLLLLALPWPLAAHEEGGSGEGGMTDDAVATNGPPGLAVCPGEFRGEQKCGFKDANGYSFTICQKLLDQGQPRTLLNGQDWWSLTNQENLRDDWVAKVEPNGDSWCTCACCTAEVINKVGCDGLEINCEATDVNFVFTSPDPDLGPMQDCLRKQCPAFVPKSGLHNAALPVMTEAPTSGHGRLPWVVGCGAAAAVSGLLVLGVTRMRRGRHPEWPPLVVDSTDEENNQLEMDSD